MAEAMLRKLAADGGLAIEVRSAGVSTVDGLPISPRAAEALRKRGVPLPGVSSSLTPATAEWADWILTMTTGHKQAIVERFPAAAGKTFTLKELSLSGAAGDMAEFDRLYTELHLKRSLGEQLPEADLIRLRELQQKLPGFDIADPYGGPLELYESCAQEIYEALRQSLDKLQKPD
jgi:protein-tyrosine phosphatase